MTDQQLLTIAIAIIFPLSMLLYSNSRITEAKETLRAEMGTLRADMGAGFARMDASFERLEAKLLIHELEHHRK
jgi:hypothetical protein